MYFVIFEHTKLINISLLIKTYCYVSDIISILDSNTPTTVFVTLTAIEMTTYKFAYILLLKIQLTNTAQKVITTYYSILIIILLGC